MSLFGDVDVELTECRNINDDTTDIECDAPSIESNDVLDQESGNEEERANDTEEYECVAKFSTEELGGEFVVCFQL